MFWTLGVKIAAALLAAEVAYDGWSTQYLISKGSTELDPLAKWLVSKGVLGQSAACLLGLGASLLAALILGHWALWVIVAAEGANIVRQYILVRKSK
jgi:hypothetical protein